MTIEYQLKLYYCFIWNFLAYSKFFEIVHYKILNHSWFKSNPILIKTPNKLWRLITLNFFDVTPFIVSLNDGSVGWFIFEGVVLGLHCFESSILSQKGTWLVVSVLYTLLPDSIDEISLIQLSESLSCSVANFFNRFGYSQIDDTIL